MSEQEGKEIVRGLIGDWNNADDSNLPNMIVKTSVVLSQFDNVPNEVLESLNTALTKEGEPHGGSIYRVVKYLRSIAE